MVVLSATGQDESSKPVAVSGDSSCVFQPVRAGRVTAAAVGSVVARLPEGVVVVVTGPAVPRHRGRAGGPDLEVAVGAGVAGEPRVAAGGAGRAQQVRAVGEDGPGRRAGLPELPGRGVVGQQQQQRPLPGRGDQHPGQAVVGVVQPQVTVGVPGRS